jgi:16S rRNA (guanine527-N7)-methyltransferase
MSTDDLDAEDFARHIDTTPGVIARLKIYNRLLLEWNNTINLVSSDTLKDSWKRHFQDSAQLLPLIPPESQNLADIGSGAGFPGLVLAIMGVKDVTLIERDTRKAGFLRTVAGETGTKIEILNVDVKTIEDRSFDIVTSRAVAALSELLELAHRFLKPSTICLFLKGKNLDPEIAQAHKLWSMNLRRMPSATEPESAILRITGIVKK